MGDQIFQHILRHGVVDRVADLAHTAAQVVQLVEQRQDDRQRGLVDLHLVAQIPNEPRPGDVDGAVHERMRPALCDEGVLKLRRVVPISMGLFDRAGDFAKDAATHSRLGVRSLEGFEFDSGSSPATQVASCAVRGPKLQGDYCTAAAA